MESAGIVRVAENGSEVASMFRSKKQGPWLTSAEARVAILVTQGHPTTEIAQEPAVQPNTIRMHVKQTYAKTREAGLTSRA